MTAVPDQTVLACADDGSERSQLETYLVTAWEGWSSSDRRWGIVATLMAALDPPADGPLLDLRDAIHTLAGTLDILSHENVDDLDAGVLVDGLGAAIRAREAMIAFLYQETTTRCVRVQSDAGEV